MKYFLQRDGRTYGPYSYDDLKRYQAESRIGPTDQVRREDSQQWEPWQQVLNPAPAAPAPAPQEPAMPPIQQGFGGYTPPAAPQPQPQQPAFGQPPQGFGGQPPAFGNNPPAYGGGGFGQPPAEQGFGGFGQQPQAPQASNVPGAFGAFGAQGGFGGPPQGQPGGFGGQPYGQPQGQQGGYGQPGGFGGQPMMQQGGGYGGGGAVGPMPPDMQWWLVALIGFLCGFFTLFWIWKQVMFVKKIEPQTQAPRFYMMGLGLIFGGFLAMILGSIAGAAMGSEVALIFPILGMAIYLCGAVCLILANFKMRASIHNYYTMVEPMGINLMDTTGAVLTFFFPIYFFQYHFFNIAERKKAMGHPAV